MVGNIAGVGQFLEAVGVPAGQAGAQVGLESGSEQNFAAAMQQAGTESGTPIPQASGGQGEEVASSNGEAASTAASQSGGSQAASTVGGSVQAAGSGEKAARRGPVASRPSAGTLPVGSKTASAKSGIAVGTAVSAKGAQAALLPGSATTVATATSTLQDVSAQTLPTAAADGQGAAGTASPTAAPAPANLPVEAPGVAGTALLAEVTAPLKDLAAANFGEGSSGKSAAGGTARAGKQTVPEDSKPASKSTGTAAGSAIDSRLTAAMAQGTATVSPSAAGAVNTGALLAASVAPVPVSAPAIQGAMISTESAGIALGAASPSGLSGDAGQKAGLQPVGSGGNGFGEALSASLPEGLSGGTAAAATPVPSGVGLPAAETASAIAADALQPKQVGSGAAGPAAPLQSAAPVAAPGVISSGVSVPMQQAAVANGAASATEAGRPPALPTVAAAPPAGTLKTGLVGGRSSFASSFAWKGSGTAAAANDAAQAGGEQTVGTGSGNAGGTGGTLRPAVQVQGAGVGPVPAAPDNPVAVQQASPAPAARVVAATAAQPEAGHKPAAPQTSAASTAATAAASAGDAKPVAGAPTAQPGVVAADAGAAAVVSVGTVAPVPHASLAAGAHASSTSLGNGTGTGDGLTAQGSGGSATGASLPHTTLSATPTSLEVGVASGTHGWLKIRAELNAAGEVNASLTGANAAADTRLRGDLPALSSYLQGEKVQVGALNVGTALHAAAAVESGSTFSFTGGANGGAVSADAGAGSRAQQQPAQQHGAQQGGDSVAVSNGAQQDDVAPASRIPDAAAYGVLTELGGSDAASSAGYGAGGGWLNVRA